MDFNYQYEIYDTSKLRDYMVLSNSREWYRTEVGIDIREGIATNGLSSTLMDVSILNKISMSIFSTPITIEDGEFKFFPPLTGGGDIGELEKAIPIGKVLKGMDYNIPNDITFPSTTIFRITKKNIEFSYLSDALLPSIENIAYTLMIIFIAKNLLET